MDNNSKFIIAKIEAILLWGALLLVDSDLQIILLVSALVLAIINLVDSVVN